MLEHLRKLGRNVRHGVADDLNVWRDGDHEFRQGQGVTIQWYHNDMTRFTEYEVSRYGVLLGRLQLSDEALYSAEDSNLAADFDAALQALLDANPPSGLAPAAPKQLEPPHLRLPGACPALPRRR